MCLSLQNTSSVGVHDVAKDTLSGAEEMQSDEGELAVQSDEDEEESECIFIRNCLRYPLHEIYTNVSCRYNKTLSGMEDISQFI